jgi:hypothetical protein
MQGTVSLAVALALPSTTTRGGSAFPQRILIMFLTFAVIFVTLAGQGLALPGPDRPPGPGKPVTESNFAPACSSSASNPGHFPFTHAEKAGMRARHWTGRGGCWQQRQAGRVTQRGQRCGPGA